MVEVSNPLQLPGQICCTRATPSGLRCLHQISLLAAVRGADLSKHIAGHTLLASMWHQVSPVLQAFVGDNNQREEAREGALRELRDVVVSREGSSSAWKSLTADALAARHRDLTDQDQQMSHDARLVIDHPSTPCPPNHSDQPRETRLIIHSVIRMIMHSSVIFLA